MIALEQPNVFYYRIKVFRNRIFRKAGGEYVVIRISRMVSIMAECFALKMNRLDRAENRRSSSRSKEKCFTTQPSYIYVKMVDGC
jgi:hypothetical protein